ncbi:MAG: PfkB family carbohydrate kinase [Planctomycetota bacterium]|nr:PfkB family carbohydrate kinase [Planctomycetota bacterium]
MPVLVVGSIALDTIRTAAGREYKEVLGGSAVYFAWAASFLAPVQLVAVVGEDFPQRHVRLLAKRKIDLAGLEIKRGGKTFRWTGTYSPDMNSRTTDDLQFGVLADFTPNLPDAYRQSEIVFLACAHPDLQLRVLAQMKRQPLLAVADTIEFYIQHDRAALERVFKRCQGVILNDAEARLIAGETNLVRAALCLLKKGLRFAVIKKGEHGCLLATAEGVFPFPAYPLARVIDPTGAGDTFAGGFMGFLAQKRSRSLSALRRAVVYGTALAAFACEGISLSRLCRLTDKEMRDRTEELARLVNVRV